MPATEFGDSPRPTLTIDCDGRLVRPMTAQAWRATFPTVNVAARYAVTTVLGVLVWMSTRSVPLALTIALLVPTVVLLVTRARIERNIRAVVGRGASLTSGYDGLGRFVVERAGGAVEFKRGDARGVERVGVVTVVRPRSRQPAFVTPSALLTDDDVTFLTAGPGGLDPVEEFRLEHAEVRHPVLVTAAVQRAVYRMSVRALVRHPLSVVVAVCAVLTIVLIARYPTPGSALVLALTLAFVAVVYVAGPRAGAQKFFPEGSVMGVAVDDRGLAIHLPGFPSRLDASELRAVLVADDGVALRARNLRTYVLPRQALTDDDLDRLRDLRRGRQVP
ncbi:MAG: hypothetical protein ABIQ13_05475 [Pedococcus sp.]